MRTSRKKPQRMVRKSREQGEWIMLAAIAGGIMLIILVPMIGVLLNWRAHIIITPPADDQQAVTQPTGQCNHYNLTAELTSESFIFNPHAVCITNLTVAEGPIEFSGPAGKFILQTREKKDLSQLWIESARAVNGHAVLLYQLVE